jgi:hypothetical protein
MNKIAREQADLYQDFFNFLSQEHNLTCTIEEMDEIIHEAQTFVKKFDIANFVVPKGTLCDVCGCENTITVSHKGENCDWCNPL